VRAGGDDRLGVDSTGEVRFDPLNAASQAPAAPPPAAKAADDKPAPDAKADAGADKPVPAGQLAHNMSGAQLSSSLGNNFGGKNIFGGNSAAPKFGAGMANIGGAAGHLSTMKASTLHPTASRMTALRGSSNRALGQGFIANSLSKQGYAAANTSAEAASSLAQGAFDQQQPVGGNLSTPGSPGGTGIGTGGGDTPPSLGGGAPGDPGGLPTAPADPTGGATDPGLQGAISQISDLANQAMSNIQTGTIMMAIGAVLIGIGCACLPFGASLIAAGVALVIMGIMKISAGKSEAAQAIAMGQQLGSAIGNEQQAAAINYCTNNAITTGTAVQNCQPPESITNQTNVTAQSAADANRVEQIPVTNTTIGGGAQGSVQ
jgi:hypothetical protein